MRIKKGSQRQHTEKPDQHRDTTEETERHTDILTSLGQTGQERQGQKDRKQNSKKDKHTNKQYNTSKDKIQKLNVSFPKRTESQVHNKNQF